MRSGSYSEVTIPIGMLYRKFNCPYCGTKLKMNKNKKEQDIDVKSDEYKNNKKYQYIGKSRRIAWGKIKVTEKHYNYICKGCNKQYEYDDLTTKKAKIIDEVIGFSFFFLLVIAGLTLYLLFN